MNKRSSKKTTWWIVALATVIAVVLLFSRTAAIESVYPVERSSAWLRGGIGARLRGLWLAQAAEAENVRLRRELELARLAAGDLERERAENDRLRLALGYSRRLGGEWRAAVVIAAGGGAAGSPTTIRVACGSDGGVRPGDIVAAAAGLVGRVVETTPHTSTVALLTDASIRIAASSDSGGVFPARGIACGGGGECLALKFVSHAESLVIGSPVVTSGLGGVFPPNFTVGTVADVITSSDDGRVLGATVRPAVDFDALEDVFIRHEP